MRHNEDIENSELASQLLDGGDDSETIDGLLELGYDSPHAKAQLLIHAKLRDGKLPIADYATDQRSVLEQAPRVLAALIDVAADAGCSHLRGNFRRPFTPSTRRWPRDCDSSMAWRFTG